MSETAAVVIIGGGVMGASIAFYPGQHFRYARFAQGDLIHPLYE